MNPTASPENLASALGMKAWVPSTSINGYFGSSELIFGKAVNTPSSRNGSMGTPVSCLQGKRLRCAPANSPITRGRGVRKPIDRLLWPLALGAWTYATGSPTPKGRGSYSKRPAALICLSRFRHPGTVRARSSSIIRHAPVDGNGAGMPVRSKASTSVCRQDYVLTWRFLMPPLRVWPSHDKNDFF